MKLLSRFNKHIAEYISKISSKYDYGFAYSYTVVSQNADNTLELEPENTKKAPPLSNVIVMYDNPATKATVKKGAKCCVFFKDGDPTQPRAFGFEHGAFELLEFGDNGFNLARQGDVVMCGGATTLCTFVGVTPVGLMSEGAQYMVSFGSIAVPPLLPTPVKAGPLPGYIFSGSTALKGKT